MRAGLVLPNRISSMPVEVTELRLRLVVVAGLRRDDGILGGCSEHVKRHDLAGRKRQ